MDFDYVIVGAGSAGCVVANRLSKDGRNRVLLLEAGPEDRGWSFQMPLGYGLSFYNPLANWMYWSEPVPGLAGRQVYVPRGKVLGGSSSINAMVYIRGQREDFDDWQAAGNPGWGWENVEHSFKAVERDLLIGSMKETAHPICQHYFDAAQGLGLPINHRPNDEEQFGAGYNPVNIHDGRRQSSSRVFIHPIRNRKNLKIATGAHARRILFLNRRAIGVEYVKDGQTLKARALREVILCAGAIGSPQLLQLSGIGPVELLGRHGIPIISANQAVGKNLQDHVCYDHYYRARVPTMNQQLRPLWGKIWAGLRYVLTRTGPLSGSMNHAGGFFRSRPGLARPNLQLYFCPSSYDRAPPKTRKMTQPDPFPGFSMSVSSCRPTSLGKVEITSPDAQVSPAIQLNLLATMHDTLEMLEGAYFLRKLAATPALTAIIAEEFKPGLAISNETELIADIRARATSIYHPCGTCKMGPDPATSVVDAKLRVYGAAGLRVADASIFPNIVAGNINAAAMMVGQRGAALLASQ
jgi:choline dehydrogenase